jgi:hypothetical protein
MPMKCFELRMLYSSYQSARDIRTGAIYAGRRIGNGIVSRLLGQRYRQFRLQSLDCDA